MPLRELDFDPFADDAAPTTSAAPKATKLVPLDFDPFEDEAPADQQSWFKQATDRAKSAIGSTAVGRGFTAGLLEQSPQNFGDALEGFGYLGGNDWAKEQGANLREWGQNAVPPEVQTRGKGILDSESISEFLTNAGETFGSGLASMTPNIAAGLGGAAAGGAAGSIVGPGGTVAGGIGGGLVGAGSVSYVQAYGELYGALKEAGVDPQRAAEFARGPAALIAAPDVASLGKMATMFTGTARKEIVQGIARRIATNAAQGMAVEGATEAAQEAIKEAAVSYETGRPWTGETAKGIAEAGLGGALVGGGMGGASGVRRPATPQAEPAQPPMQEGEPWRPTVTPEPRLVPNPITGDPGDPVDLNGPELSEGDLLSPIKNLTIQKGKEAVDRLIGQGPQQNLGVPPEERAILRAAGLPDDEIDIMSPAERAADVRDLRNSGVVASPEDVAAAGQYAAGAAPAPVEAPGAPPSEVAPPVAPQIAPEAAAPVESPAGGAEVDAAAPVQAPVAGPIRPLIGTAGGAASIEPPGRLIDPDAELAVGQPVKVTRADGTEVEATILGVRPDGKIEVKGAFGGRAAVDRAQISAPAKVAALPAPEPRKEGVARAPEVRRGSDVIALPDASPIPATAAPAPTPEPAAQEPINAPVAEAQGPDINTLETQQNPTVEAEKGPPPKPDILTPVSKRPKADAAPEPVFTSPPVVNQPDVQAKSATSEARQRWQKRIRELEGDGSPGSGTAVGSTGERAMQQAEAIRAVLRATAKGMSPEDAGKQAKQEIRAVVARHNARRKGDVNWQVWDGQYDSTIDNVVADLRRELEPSAPTDILKAAEPAPAVPAAERREADAPPRKEPAPRVAKPASAPAAKIITHGSPIPFKRKRGQSVEAAAKAHVVDAGKKTGVEHILIFKGDVLVSNGSGGAANSGWSAELDVLLADDGDAVIHHNHPSSSPISRGDLRLLGAMLGIRLAWAHGHNGRSFSAALPDDMRAKLKPMNLANRGRTMENAYLGAMRRVKKHFQDMEVASKITIAKLNEDYLYHQAIMVVLDRAGIIDYTDTESTAEAVALLGDSLDAYADEIRRAIGLGRNDRRAGRPSAQGAVAQVPGGDAKAAADGGGQGGDRAGGRSAKKPRPVSRLTRLENFFRPGRVIKSWAGHDKVLAFSAEPAANDWSVRVVAVNPDGSEIPGERPRAHSTEPSPRELAAWEKNNPVGAAAAPVMANALRENPGRAKVAARERREVEAIVRRIAGPGVDLRMDDPIPTDPDAARASGGTANTVASGSYDGVDDVMHVALGLGENSRLTAAHESFHRLEFRGIFTEAEMVTMEAETERMRAAVKKAYPFLNTEDMPGYEVRAYAFELYEADRRAGKISTWLKAPIRTAFDRLYRIIRAVRAYLAGRGFKTYEDVFEAAARGDVAKRAERVEPRFDGTAFAMRDGAPSLAYSMREGIPSADDLTPSAASRFKAGLNKLTPKSDAGRGAKRRLIDYLEPVDNMVRRAGASVQAHLNVYLAARLADDQTVDRMMRFEEDFQTPLIELMRERDVSLEDLHSYLLARHAPERNAKIAERYKADPGHPFARAATDDTVAGGSGISNAEARARLAAFDKAGKLDGLRAAEKIVRDMVDSTRKTMLEAGLISEKQYEALTKDKFYVPLKGEELTNEFGDSTAPAKGKGFNVKGKDVKGATGRFTQAENIPAWIVADAQRAILRAQKNLVGKTALRFAKAMGKDFAEVSVADEINPETGEPYQIKSYREIRREVNAKGHVVEVKVPHSDMYDDTIAVKVGGETRYIRFKDEAVGRALKKLGNAELNVFMATMREVTVWQSVVNTRLNPAFMPINFLRDAMAGTIHLLDEGFGVVGTAKILANVPSAMRAIYRDARGKEPAGDWATIAEQYKRVGGKIVFMDTNTVEDIQKRLQKALSVSDRSALDPREVGKAILKWIGDANDAVDNGIRLATFAAAQSELGKSPSEAALMARDLTVDFKRRGEIGPYMNASYAFFNASIQGNYNILSRLLTSPTVRAAAGVMILGGFVQGVLNSILSGDDDEGEEDGWEAMVKYQGYKTERSVVIFTGPGKDDYFSFPLPYGYNAFHYLGLQMSNMLLGYKSAGEGVVDATRVTFDAYNPLGSGGSMWNMLLPTVADPFIDITLNKNFAGAPIRPTQSRNDVSPASEHNFEKTHPAWIALAKGLNKATGGDDVRPGLIDRSPDDYEHLWGWVAGGIGRFASQVTKSAGDAANGEIKPEEIPIVKQFYGKRTDQDRRGEYYKLRDNAKATKEWLKDYRERGNEEAFEKLKAEHPEITKTIGAFDAAEKSLQGLRKQRNHIRGAKDLEDARREELLKLNEERQLAVMNRARAAYAKARHEMLIEAGGE